MKVPNTGAELHPRLRHSAPPLRRRIMDFQPDLMASRLLIRDGSSILEKDGHGTNNRR